MIDLYHNDMSVCAQKVRLALAELGLPWTSHHLKLRGTEQFSPEYLAINPKGQVPSLVYDGFVVVESTVINEYLSDRTEGSQLVPATPEARARMRWWTRQLDDDIHFSTAVVSASLSFLHQYLAVGKEKLDEIINSIPDEGRRILKINAFNKAMDNPDLPKSARRMFKLFGDLNATLRDNEWLSGATFSLADVGLTPYVLRMQHLQMSVMFEGRPHLLRWMQAVQARPSFDVAINKWLNRDYLTLMAKSGAEAEPHVAEMTRA